MRPHTLRRVGCVAVSVVGSDRWRGQGRDTDPVRVSVHAGAFQKCFDPQAPDEERYRTPCRVLSDRGTSIGRETCPVGDRQLRLLCSSHDRARTWPVRPADVRLSDTVPPATMGHPVRAVLGCRAR